MERILPRSTREALALASENGRAFQRELVAWCGKKATHPGWRLSEHDALAGLKHPDRDHAWTFGRLFRHLGVALRSVELDCHPHAEERGRLRAVIREPDGSIYEDREDGMWPVRGPGGDA